MTVEETRIVTRRLRERPDDSWTIEGAVASGAYAFRADCCAVPVQQETW